jgi:hypothetical protein
MGARAMFLSPSELKCRFLVKGKVRLEGKEVKPSMLARCASKGLGSLKAFGTMSILPVSGTRDSVAGRTVRLRMSRASARMSPRVSTVTSSFWGSATSSKFRFANQRESVEDLPRRTSYDEDNDEFYSTVRDVDNAVRDVVSAHRATGHPLPVRPHQPVSLIWTQSIACADEVVPEARKPFGVDQDERRAVCAVPVSPVPALQSFFSGRATAKHLSHHVNQRRVSRGKPAQFGSVAASLSALLLTCTLPVLRARQSIAYGHGIASFRTKSD